MKNPRNALLLTSALLLAFGAGAQVRIGVKAGINSALLHYPNLESGVAVNPRIDFQGGLLMDIPASKSFSIQPALLISTKGTTIDAQLINGNTGAVISPVHNTIKLLYAEVPVLAMFRTHISPSLKLYGGLGPYVGIGIGGRLTSNVLGERDKIFGSGVNGSNNYRRVDYGASAAAGVEVGRLLVGVNYNYGLIDLGTASSRAYNRNIGISIGYWFSRVIP